MSGLHAILCLLVASHALDAPRLLPAPRLLLAAASEVPQNLGAARRLADQLRFEEALVEYQRYLGDPNRPTSERAKALLELGFLHLILGDDVNAKQRTVEALELDPALRPPLDAPKKQLDFLKETKADLESRPHLAILSRTDAELPGRIAARLTDPKRRARSVLLRYSLAPAGPFYGASMHCEAEICVGDIAPPSGASAYTAWYYLEALDGEGNTVAQASSPASPLQVSVIAKSPWYKSPWVWGGGAAFVIGVAAVFYATTSVQAK